MALEAAIFDRDGVLLDFDLHAAATFFRPLLPVRMEELLAHWMAWSAQAPAPSTLEEEAAFWDGLWSYVAKQLNLDPAVEQQCRAFDYTTVLRPYPDARPALEAVRQAGLQVAVLSNFSLASIDASLAAIGMADLIDVATAASVIRAAKPDAAAYRHVTERLGVAPEACLFFDDEMPHVKGASALGMRAYLVNRSMPEHDLESGVVSDLSALPAILSANGGR